MVTTSPLFDGTGGHPALDFINTVDRHPEKPWFDRLRGFEDLLEWSRLAGTLSKDQRLALEHLAQVQPDRAEAVLERARALREAGFRIFGALLDGVDPAPGDLEHLNGELARALGRTRIEARGEAFALGWDPDLDQPLWPIARATADLLTSPDRHRIKRCASATCLWLFLDHTKNHRRRWCDMKVCGNRDKVRRHRHRARSRGGSGPGVG